MQLISRRWLVPLLTRLMLTTGISAESSDSTSTTNNPSDDALKIVTWNVEHLAYPIDKGCRPRTEEELAKLQAYAKSLDADIVALQEVASKAAIYQLFPADEWTVIMSGRPSSPPYDCRGSGFKSTQQKVAFAIKKPMNIFGV